MKKFILCAKYTEFLPTLRIEAETLEEAKEEYTNQWENGMLLINDSALDIFEIKEES